MADKKKSVNLLPEYLRTDKNSKFLSSTIDQFIQTPDLERVDGYVGSKITPNFNPTADFYIKSFSSLRNNYSLEPAMVFKDKNSDITNVVSFDDLLNELTTQKADTNNIDKLLRSKFYSYNPMIDWDKLVNFTKYFWLPEGPEPILVATANLDVTADIIGQPSYDLPYTYTVDNETLLSYKLSNGMKISFANNTLQEEYRGRTYLVEGVGSAIKLIDYDLLGGYESMNTFYDETFDSDGLDEYPFDSDRRLPLTAEYITINRASDDLNPWSRYNRWFHEEIIKTTAEINNSNPIYLLQSRARRPIIEFKANLQLYNFGKVGISNVDYIDTVTTDALGIVNGSNGYYVDGLLLQQGDRVIFNADLDKNVRGKIYRVSYSAGLSPVLSLTEIIDPSNLDSVAVNFGSENAGTSWYYNSSIKKWEFAQQHTELNQPPLFDLFNSDGDSYTSTDETNNFSGNKIFGYDIGTGTPDVILGFPLKYQNSIGVGSYLFKNYFMTDTITIVSNNLSTPISTSITYLKVNNLDGDYELKNVWDEAAEYQIPIIEVQTLANNTGTLTLTSLDYPIDTNISVTAFVNEVAVPVTVDASPLGVTVDFNNILETNTTVMFKIITDQLPNDNGYYETPIGLTSNPLNGPVADMTLSELADHLTTMVNRLPNYTGSNLRDFDNYERYGTRLVINYNPISFVKIFLGTKEHNVIDALRVSATHYNQFKLNFLNRLINVNDQMTPQTAVDTILRDINLNKNFRSPYYRSDMVGVGQDKTVRSYIVGPFLSTKYPLGIEFDLERLSFQSVIVYINGDQKLIDKDYTFDFIEGTVNILAAIEKDDEIEFHIYSNTLGSYVPPTPTKLGLYPKFTPEKFNDTTYLSEEAVAVIRGHDGSIMVAYNDYRDDIILELEKRIYNNIKVRYKNEIFDINSVIPGAFRSTNFSLPTINNILEEDFTRWVGLNSVDAYTNELYDESNPFTYNYKNTLDTKNNAELSGFWRAIYKHFYDTDDPLNRPWEMLGHSEKPLWWDTYYDWNLGPRRTALISALITGRTEEPPSTVVNPIYARPGFVPYIPLSVGLVLRIPQGGLTTINSLTDRQDPWRFGDQAPAETAWRRSSYWPFVANILAALSDPCGYCSSMYDVSRTELNSLNQLTYTDDDLYLSPKKLAIDGENNSSIAGFGVYVLEKGQQKDINYSVKLRQDLDYLDFNLFHKLGGFASKEKLQIKIDSIDPLSTSPGVVLPPEDYSLILNVSNPVKTLGISGIIVQRSDGYFVLKGYDVSRPYFEILSPIKTAASGAITVGGTSAPFTDWSGIENNGNSGLGAIELISATSTTSRFYKQGQIVRYNNKYYRVKVNHSAKSDFDTTLFQQLSSLPIKGGASAQLPARYSTTTTKIPYGSKFTKIQDVVDVILGYGAYLESLGFVFDEFNKDLTEVVDWKFTAKEFLFWTTQNWANNNLITLSPFSDSLKVKLIDSVVDNISSGNYDYSLLKADGKSFPIQNFALSREDDFCVIKTLNTEEGLFFARLNFVQKEHSLVFNNSTIFNDTIYDIETGYKQRRIKLSGFRTKNWNGDYFSPGFVYDDVRITDWTSFENYLPGDVVRYNGAYYTSKIKILGDKEFNFSKWVKLLNRPVSELLPNFDYKINQFEDFYSLDIDNFDDAQQQLAQHLIGYTPRTYLNNIFTNSISQYKFYQGFIKEKGTKNSIDRLSKATSDSIDNAIEFNEEWAFRVGAYGGQETYQELEFALEEGTSLENPYLVKLVDEIPVITDPLINYVTPADCLITPVDYVPSNSFATLDSTWNDNNLELTTAGYVKLDDVTATAYNKNSLLDIANNSIIKDGDTFWVGFLENGSWSVYRYTKQTPRVSGVFVSSPGTEITFVTNLHHYLTVGDIVSVVNFNNQVNGVYIVKSVPKLNQFVVSSELTTIENEQLLAYGSLFKFDNARFSDFSAVANKPGIVNLKDGDKLWVDSGVDSKWQVFEKINNYSSSYIESNDFILGQQLGYSVYAKDTSDVVLTSSPSWRTTGTHSWGRVKAFTKIGNVFRKDFEYSINSADVSYVNSTTTAEFGYSLAYDVNKQIYFAGAPSASNVKFNGTTGTVIISTGSETASAFTEQGVVKISSNNDRYDEETTNAVLISPYPVNHERFGHALYVNQVTTTSTLLLVGAPGNAVLPGNVYAYLLDKTSTVTNVIAHPTGISIVSASTLTFVPGDRFGADISGSSTGNVIAVSAPNHSVGNSTGVVIVYSYNTATFVQTQILRPDYEGSSNFGERIEVSPSGTYIIVTDSDYKIPNRPYGRAMIYKKGTENQYTLLETILNPIQHNDLKFGSAISINENEDILVISSLGINRSRYIEFDATSRSGQTTFDNDTTKFLEPIKDSGEVYVFNKLGEYFVMADEISNEEVSEGSKFGISVAATNDTIYVGAPSSINTVFPDDSKVFIYSAIDVGSKTWNPVYEQHDVVDVSKFKRIALIDSLKEEIVDYLEIIDPVKGKIAGIAEREIKFKSASDPAVYTLGTAGTVNDSQSNWIDEHIGNLWWDLSTAKYVWYEQGSETYRKNNWGKLFPGATIDVYEWVKSDVLPSEWAAQADTNEGLTQGISGQPKYPDNTVLSVKQIYNNVTNSFENVYYFWVKNKVTIPSVTNRKISSLEVASIIADPTAYGLKFVQILSNDAIAFANVQPMLSSNNIDVSIAFDTVNNIIPRHTEWLLLNEGDANSVPNFLLEKKLFDSLLGQDSDGRLVPDITLTDRTRYGLGIRPQQSLFKDRLEALRNLITFSNSVLIQNQIAGNYSFNYLNKQEEIPNERENEYDILVEDLDTLSEINTVNFKQATIQCYVENGKIKTIEILDPGYGYIISPSVTVISTVTSTAKILTTLDSEGRIVETEIFDAGQEFTSAPELVVRPHSAVVQVNTDYGNRWTLHNYDYVTKEWIRVRSQAYNTPLYWNTVDWKSIAYNEFKIVKFTVSNLYELNSLTEVALSDYVKVKNNGQGKFVILERVSQGDYTSEYNLVYSQDGTLQFKDSLWDYDSGKYAYDIATLEETLYDQIPDRELYYILLALRDEIFINNLKVNWNLFFFAAVKYALTEQKLLDWAFKTSFINVRNVIGELGQRPMYRLDNESYYEQYVNEVKPYHTKIRSYTSNYNLFDEFTSEISAAQITDFDLPSYYNSSTGRFKTVELGDPLLADKPWIDWAQNYKFEVGTIIVADGGAGYSQNPTVIVTTASGDTGSGAEAEAYIRNGSVYKIVVTNAGKDYVIPPVVSIVGGGPTVSKVARVSVTMSNTKVRRNTIGIKFDRISKEAEIEDIEVTDEFLCTGGENKFTLNWLANRNKLEIVPTLDGRLVLATDYTIEYFTEEYSNTTKKFSRFVFLNYVPKPGQKLKIRYQKSIDLYNAIDRIDKFYSPTETMIGKDYNLLMSGLEYPRTQLQGLEFKDTPPWGTTRYDEAPWGDLLSNFAEAKIVQPVSTSTTTIFLNTTTGISIGQSLLAIVKDATTSSYFRQDTVVQSINTSARSITITAPQYQLKEITSTATSAGSVIVVKTENDFNGDIRPEDIVVLYGITTSGYNNEYVITTCTNNTFEIVAKTTLGNIVADITTSSYARVYSVKEHIFNTSTVLDTVVGISSGTTSTILKSYSQYTDFVTATVASPTGFWNTFTVVSSSTGYVDVQVFGLTTSIQTVLTATIYGYTGIEFWTTNASYSSVDTALSAGTWAGDSLNGALGISPEDIIIDGDAFINPNSSHAPEEYVPGHTLDSVGINVYTAPEISYPTVITGAIPITQGEFTNWPLFIQAESPVAIMVYFNGTLFDRIDIPNGFSADNQFYLYGNILQLPPQDISGNAFYTMLFTGAKTQMDAGYVAASNFEASTSSVAVVTSNHLSISDVRSVYVTIDGVEILPYTGTGTGYTVGPSSSNNKRAAVTVYLPNNSRIFNIEAWFFSSPYVKFNKFIEEIHVENQGIEWTYKDLSLTQSELEPYSSQVIVTIGTDSQRRRLRPPKVSYYKAQINQITFDIDNKKDRTGVFNLSNINVYLNGNSLRPGFDFLVDTVAETVTIINGLVERNDVIAVEMLDDYEYLLKGNRIYFKEAISNTILQILSFANNADMNIRTERFSANNAHEYTLSLPVLNQNYAWVSVGNRMLVSGIEYAVQSNYRTILISDDIVAQPDDEVIVTTVNPPLPGSQIVGYRIFKDIFERHSFKRLSEYHSASLARPLTHTDTEIHVINGSSLTHPNPEKNIPGIVIVDGERIEYFTKNGNILSQLRRSTLGTGPSFYSQIGTRVIDQSIKQTIPTIDYSLEQRIPASNTTTYTISASTLTFASGVTGQGIVIVTETDDDLPPPQAVDQVEVYYGGRKLRKSSLVVHDTTISYDTSTASLTVLSPEFSINTSTQQLTLNIDEEIIPGTRITVIKRETERWTEESLLTSNVRQAAFLRARPAELPDSYYYGGELDLTDENFAPLTTDSGDSLQGF